MTRREAVNVIYSLINSGVLCDDINEQLNEVANCICYEGFDKCEADGDMSHECIACRFLER
jgi:hypothetical protein